MKWCCLILALLAVPAVWAGNGDEQKEADYYVTEYARHYHVPVELVRAVVEQESGWHRCPVSSKGAVGLLQLMPQTAKRLNVKNRCDLRQNISGGVRYLAWLMTKFQGELRLVAAAYYAGETHVLRRGLRYANPDVVKYVASIRERVARQQKLGGAPIERTPGRSQ
ncbi:MAG TPA: lytic transglycosylase domain-containing protein [Candidatus Angelobacter sp.]|nr:lytic transglycosylase domain-containing protein [Candidatus Angelobacter sp.]